MSRKNPPETPLYVKLPTSAVEKLDRAAAALGVAKKDLVAGLVGRYVDPDSQRGLSALGTLAAQQKPIVMSTDGSATLGSYSFQPYEQLPEVMDARQAGQFLQIDEKHVLELAESGKIPGRKLGPVWRFSREALVAWLAKPERR